MRRRAFLTAAAGLGAGALLPPAALAQGLNQALAQRAPARPPIPQCAA